MDGLQRAYTSRALLGWRGGDCLGGQLFRVIIQPSNEDSKRIVPAVPSTASQGHAGSGHPLGGSEASFREDGKGGSTSGHWCQDASPTAWRGPSLTVCLAAADSQPGISP